jgi:hypothetical protein
MLSLVLTFLGGVIVGSATIGALSYRTICMYDGEINWVLVMTTVVSISYWFGVKYVVTDNLVGYVGFALGEAAIVAVITYRQKLKKMEKEKEQ